MKQEQEETTRAATPVETPEASEGVVSPNRSLLRKESELEIQADSSCSPTKFSEGLTPLLCSPTRLSSGLTPQSQLCFSWLSSGLTSLPLCSPTRPSRGLYPLLPLCSPSRRSPSLIPRCPLPTLRGRTGPPDVLFLWGSGGSHSQ
eukprot:GHVR01160486.1.p1 GENE.GHVR01160486.1~~GHVR01160486.1.p1  ORF type:complete len:146 (+),score=25.70 GHVR01160486.1:231-668(+)